MAIVAQAPLLAPLQVKPWTPLPSLPRPAPKSQLRGHLSTWTPFVVLMAMRSSARKGRRFTLVRKVSELSVEEIQDTVDTSQLSKGTPVKVVGEDIAFWHVPGSKGKPFNPYGLEGEVVSVIEDEHLTANRPVLVKLTKAPGKSDGFKAFPAHFSGDEIEILALEDEKAEGTGVQSGARAPDNDGKSLMHLEDDRWAINLLYDGDCPSCMKQVEFLQKRMDENPQYQGLVVFTNLHDPDYNPELCGGVVFEDGMRHIHAVTRDGEVIAGMDVFRRIYSIVGMQWVYEITTLPLVGAFFDWLYDWFSEYRLRAAGREDILEKVHNHQAKIQELSEAECEVECEVDWDHLDRGPKVAPSRPI